MFSFSIAISLKDNAQAEVVARRISAASPDFFDVKAERVFVTAKYPVRLGIVVLMKHVALAVEKGVEVYRLHIVQGGENV